MYSKIYQNLNEYIHIHHLYLIVTIAAFVNSSEKRASWVLNSVSLIKNLFYNTTQLYQPCQKDSGNKWRGFLHGNSL